MGLTASSNPAQAGQAVTFADTVFADTYYPTGTVTFSLGSATLGTVALTNGTATFTTSSLPVGDDTITATYSGDTLWQSRTNSFTETITA